MEFNEIISEVKIYGMEESIRRSKYPMAVDVSKVTSTITDMTNKLATCPKGEAHDNFLHGIIVQFDLTLTVKCWTESERYHWFEIISSQSTMHKITKFDLDKCYIEYVDPRIVDIMKEKVDLYNLMVKEKYPSEEIAEQYLKILYSNPCGCKLTAGMTTNYCQLKTIYSQRKNHRLPEWKAFCKWIETLPNADWITTKTKEIN